MRLFSVDQEACIFLVVESEEVAAQNLTSQCDVEKPLQESSITLEETTVVPQQSLNKSEWFMYIYSFQTK